MKQCSQCGLEKELTQFYRRKNRPDLQPACKGCYREKQLSKRYSFTKDEYNQMITKQGGKCATCNTAPKGKFQVDHCHSSGITRRLLCTNCNTALGLVKENIETLSTMVMYVNYFSELAAHNTNTANQLERVG